MNSPLLQGLFLSLLLLFSSQTQAADVKVSDYGAVINDGIDDTEAIQRAIIALRSGDNLVFQNGTYNVSPGTNDASTGFLGNLFPVYDKNNITLKGNGATFYGQKWKSIWRFVRCDNIRIENFSIDWDHNELHHAGGQVVGSGTNGKGKYKDIKLDPIYKQPTSPRGAQFFGTFDPIGNRPAAHGQWYINTHMHGIPLDNIGTDVIRVYTDQPLPNRSHQLVFYRKFGGTIISFRDCDGMHLEGITMSAQVGSGCAVEGGSDLTANNIKVLKKTVPGTRQKYWLSAGGDVWHIFGMRGRFQLTNSYHEGMGDDGLNICTNYLRIKQRDGSKAIRVQNAFKRHQSPLEPFLSSEGQEPQAGDKISFSPNPNPFGTTHTLTVDESYRVGALTNPNSYIYVKFKENIPSTMQAEDYIINKSALPSSTLIQNVKLSNVFSRGFVITAPNTIIRNCTMNFCSGSAISIGADTRTFWEGPIARDVLVENCMFNQCNFGHSERTGLVNLHADYEYHMVATNDQFFQDITFRNNFFSPHPSNTESVGLSLKSCDNIVLEENRFHGDIDDRIQLEYAGCNIQVNKNSFLHPWPFGGKLRHLPGTIEAEHFDYGREGHSHFDRTSENRGTYRTAWDEADIWWTGRPGDYFVGHIGCNEWLKYGVYTTRSGTYQLGFRVGLNPQTSEFHLEQNGVDISGPITVSKTSGWKYVYANVDLSMGINSIKVVFDRGGISFDKITSRLKTVPTRLNPEDGELSVYPNPARDQVNITFPMTADEKINFKIYSISGALIKSGTYEAYNGLNSLRIDLQDFTSGMYRFSLIGQEGNQIGGSSFVVK